MGEIFQLERPREALAFTGERFTSAETGQIAIEHVHRYFLARHFCRGRDVLDVASGEGYGAALLAQVARSVIGVDIADDAIAHAIRNYARDNLGFRKGSGSELPLGDASVDVVVSFETIEHLVDHERFLGEIRRVLRPDGLLVLSTPDRDIYSPQDQPSNPHHVHELTRREFDVLLRRHFPAVRMFGQRPMLGSAIIADVPQPRTELPLVFEQRGEQRAESSEGLPRATYLIALASTVDPGPLPESLYIFSGNIDKLFLAVRELHGGMRELRARVQDEERQVAKLREQLHAMAERVALEQSNGETRLTAAVLRLEQAERERAAAEGARDHARADLARRSAELAAERGRAAAELADERARAESRAERLVLTALSRIKRFRRLSPLRYVHGLRAERVRARRILEAVRASRLFDPGWYLAHHEDVRTRGIDPYEHFVRHGADEGRDPGPGFSTMYYLLSNPDLLGAEHNPLEHYERFGRAEGRSPVPERPAEAEPPAPVSPEEAAPTPSARIGDRRLRIAFVSGEADTPGHRYRVLRHAEAARALGAEVSVQSIAEAARDPSLVEAARLVVLWRVEWNAAASEVVDTARAAGAALMFDIDDLMFDPQFATVSVIDGIRSQGFSEPEVQGFYGRVQQTLNAADVCSATTPFLARQLRRWDKPTFVLPNGFDEAIWRTARAAVRGRRAQASGAPTSDGLLRIGYAGGSRTHQRDFAVVAGAVGRVLAERPECRLVLFSNTAATCLDISEFPEIAAVEAQVEWREFVPPEDLPRELARFDVNLAPLEVGNPFCESKSELKFFEAALAGVASICSPTGCYAAALRDGETGFLARTEDEWYRAIVRLLDDPLLRARMARDAYYDVLWPFGAERRIEAMASVIEQVLHAPRQAARAFELEMRRRQAPRAKLPAIPEAEVILHADAGEDAEVTVIVPLYNYGHYLPEALDSVLAQTLPTLDLVVVDDASTDDSLDVARGWMERHGERFNRLVLLRNRANAGLALTRNVGFAAAETPFVLQLDADNKLFADCAARCLEAIKSTWAAYVYPTLQQFGDAEDMVSTLDYDAARLAGGNYIDATALVRLAAWAAIGGYEHMRYGWEDYDAWCRMAERGLFGHHLPEVLALYRVHGRSMLRTVTDVAENRGRVMAAMHERHPWVFDPL